MRIEAEIVGICSMYQLITHFRIANAGIGLIEGRRLRCQDHGAKTLDLRRFHRSAYTLRTSLVMTACRVHMHHRLL